MPEVLASRRSAVLLELMETEALEIGCVLTVEEEGGIEKDGS